MAARPTFPNLVHRNPRNLARVKLAAGRMVEDLTKHAQGYSLWSEGR